MTENNSEPCYFNDVWCFYFHDPNDNSWTNDSYKMLGTLSTVEDFWEHHSQIKSHVKNGMFFFMREHIQPTWDDPINITGGCLSIKVLKEEVDEFWESLSVKLLGETLLIESKRHLWNNINGISTSPKKHFCIIKVWVKDPCVSFKEYFNIPTKFHGDILYKSNMDNIQNDQTKTKS